MLIRGVVEVFEAFFVVLITEDFEMVSESALVVPSFSKVLITLLKILEAVVDVVMPVTKANSLVEFLVEEIFTAVEESIGIGMGLLAVASVAAIAWVVIVATPAVIADKEDVEVGLEVLSIALVTNVVVSKDVT